MVVNKRKIAALFSARQPVVNVVLLIALMTSTSAYAQNREDSAFKPSAKLWGLAYGDYSYKAKSDSLNRGGVNQYTGIRQNQNYFQFRRIYLGFDYQMSKHFSSEFLLASEDNSINTASPSPPASGDLLADNKIAPFVKLANVTWKNIWHNANLTIGQTYTPAAVLLPEAVWDYRCIERTVSDIRRTPTYDMGIALRSTFYDTKHTELGYTAMVGNGTSAKPENDAFKWFYGDVYAKLFNKHVVMDLYSDYTKINWTSSWHHDRSMVKALVAYTTPKITVGVEAFYISLMNDDIASRTATIKDTITTKASAISVFARGRIYKDLLGFFIRYDNYNPAHNNQNSIYEKYAPVTTTYDPNTKEQFFTAGIDYSPISKIHIMPNVWYNAYNNAGPLNNPDSYDLVFRLSLYYVYGK